MVERYDVARAKAIIVVVGMAVCGLLTPMRTSATGAAVATTPAPPPTDPCKATVLRFERALATMRETQGDKAGEALKEKLLPAKLQSEILFKDGYCGLAKYIQEKKLDR